VDRKLKEVRKGFKRELMRGKYELQGVKREFKGS